MIARDKQQHFIAGAAIASTLVAYGVPPIWAFVISVAIGAAKEARDSLGYGTPDFWDFVATGAGATVVLPLI